MRHKFAHCIRFVCNGQSEEVKGRMWEELTYFSWFRKKRKQEGWMEEECETCTDLKQKILQLLGSPEHHKVLIWPLYNKIEGVVSS